eukprot:gene40155-54291_t
MAPPFHRRSTPAINPLASTSRLLVGSSRISRSGSEANRPASRARDNCPPLRLPDLDLERPTSASAATTAYKAANTKMHKDMDIAFTGDADADFVRGMIPHHQGAIDMARPGITVPQGAVAVTVSKTGEVQITLAGTPAPQTIGQLQLATFVNEAGLEAQGGNNFLET